MKFTLLSIGKTRSKACAELEDEYARRITGRFTVERTYVKNEKELLEALSKTKATIVVLDEHGSVMNSREFAQHLDALTRTTAHIIFVIGDAEGIPEALRAYDHDVMALSEMTFPHEVARVLLLEQLYRAKTILDGHPYHK